MDGHLAPVPHAFYLCDRSERGDRFRPENELNSPVDHNRYLLDGNVRVSVVSQDGNAFFQGQGYFVQELRVGGIPVSGSEQRGRSGNIPSYGQDTMPVHVEDSPIEEIPCLSRII